MIVITNNRIAPDINVTIRAPNRDDIDRGTLISWHATHNGQHYRGEMRHLPPVGQHPIAADAPPEVHAARADYMRQIEIRALDEAVLSVWVAARSTMARAISTGHVVTTPAASP